MTKREYQEVPAIMTHKQANCEIAVLYTEISPSNSERLFFGGSWLRGLSTVGDIDMAFASDNYNRIVSHLRKKAIQVVTQGIVSQYLMRHSEGFAYKLDVWLAKPGWEDTWGALCTFVAGDGLFNIRMRQKAIRQRATLCQYGLTANGVIIPTPSEDEVFSALGMPWVPYERRSLDNSKQNRRPTHEYQA
jgi:DNA polymerase (family 10)